MITIVTEASTNSSVATNTLLNMAYRLLLEHADKPEFTTVRIERNGCAFQGKTLCVELTRTVDRNISESWGFMNHYDLPPSAQISRELDGIAAQVAAFSIRK